MIFLLVYILLPLVIGVLFISWGIYELGRGRFKLSDNRGVRLQQGLATWQIFIEPSKHAQVLKDISYCWGMLRTFLVFGFGVAMSLMGIAMAGVALLTKGTLLVGDSMRGEPFAAVAFLILIIGGGIGGAFGMKYIRNTTSYRVAYADLRQRQLSDYRSILLQVLPVIWVVWNVVAVCILIPSNGAPVHVQLMDNTTLLLPRWTLGIIPAVMVLTIVLVELLSRRVSLFSRLPVTSEPAIVQRVDDMFRAQIVNSLLGVELITLGSLTTAQYSSMVLSAGAPWYIIAILMVSFLIGFFMPIIGLFTILFRGRLGGKVSGWPWQSRAAA